MEDDQLVEGLDEGEEVEGLDDGEDASAAVSRKRKPESDDSGNKRLKEEEEEVRFGPNEWRADTRILVGKSDDGAVEAKEAWERVFHVNSTVLSLGSPVLRAALELSQGDDKVIELPKQSPATVLHMLIHLDPGSFFDPTGLSVGEVESLVALAHAWHVDSMLRLLHQWIIAHLHSHLVLAFEAGTAGTGKYLWPAPLIQKTCKTELGMHRLLFHAYSVPVWTKDGEISVGSYHDHLPVEKLMTCSRSLLVAIIHRFTSEARTTEQNLRLVHFVRPGPAV